MSILGASIPQSSLSAAAVTLTPVVSLSLVTAAGTSESGMSRVSMTILISGDTITIWQSGASSIAESMSVCPLYLFPASPSASFEIGPVTIPSTNPPEASRAAISTASPEMAPPAGLGPPAGTSLPPPVSIITGEPGAMASSRAGPSTDPAGPITRGIAAPAFSAAAAIAATEPINAMSAP
jgi:hypothetical protein